MDYSVVVPALNEEESLVELYGEIRQALDATGGRWELVFVDDGSSDGTAAVMRRLSEADPRVRSLIFSRNFGKSAAYSAAFAVVRGDVVITMDADLQDDPAELPKLLAELGRGNDLVIGWKMGRLENEPTKTLPSRVFNGLNRLLFGVSFRDQNSGYRAMRLQVARALDLHGDNYRFIPQLAHLSGFRVAQVGVVHRKRKFGYSKYGVRRFWTGLLDALTVRFLTGFRRKPLHFFGTAGLAVALAGGGLEFYVLARKLLGGTFQEHVAALIIGVMLLIVGFQSILIGLLGELFAAPSSSHFHVVASYGHDATRANDAEPTTRREPLREPA